MKILIIGEMIFNNINLEEVYENGMCYKKITSGKNEWYYISGERFQTNYQTYITFAQNIQIELILIHKGPNNSYLEILRDNASEMNCNIPIEGFHMTDSEVCRALIEQDFNKIFEFIIKPKIFLPKLSDLKHEIISLLDPVKIDLEFLIEKNFNDNCWGQICNGNGKYSNDILSIFKQVKGFIFNIRQNKNSLEEIVEKANLNDNLAFDDIKNMLKDSNYTDDKNLNNLLEALRNGDKEQVVRIIRLYGNLFNDWYFRLIDNIEKLMKAL